MAQDPPPTAAATPPASRPASPVPSPAAQGEADWATQVTNTIDQYVGLVRDRTTKPAIVIARGLVFGVMLAILGITAVVLTWIALTTGLTALTGKAWITDAILGGIFVIVGAFLMSKRRPKEIDF